MTETRIHLVHGTWPSGGWFAHHCRFARSKDALWFENDSDFRGAVSRALGSAATFSSFTWSGNNSIRARCKATEEFKEYWKSEILRDRHSQHYVIAHSHGGNVVLQALLSAPGTLKPISGVIALGTPFLWFDLPPASLLWKAMAWLSQVGAFSYIFALSMMFAYSAVDTVNTSVAFAILILALLAWIPLSWHLVARADQCRKEALEVRAPQGEDLPPMLVVRSPGDEASFGLRASLLYGGLLVTAWYAFAALFRIDGTARRAIFRVFVLILAATVVGIWLEASQYAGWPFTWLQAGEVWTDDAAVWLNRFGAGAKAMYLGSIGFGVLTACAASIPLAEAFGPELLRIALLVSPMVEDSPPHVRVELQSLRTSTGPRHSVYANPEVVGVITRWIFAIGQDSQE